MRIERHEHIRPEKHLAGLTMEPISTYSGRLCKKKGASDRKIIGTGKTETRRYFLHATKGFRSERIPLGDRTVKVVEPETITIES